MEIDELKKRSNAFVRGLDSYMEMAVQEVAPDLVQLNRDQMLASKTATDKTLTPTKADGSISRLFISGDFQQDMQLQTRGDDFDISSGVFYTEKLIGLYGDDIFGIAPSKENKAQILTTNEMIKLFNRNVIE